MLLPEDILIKTLVDLGLLSPADLTDALEYQIRLPQSQLKPITQILIDLEFVSEPVLQFLQQECPIDTLKKVPQALQHIQALQQECLQTRNNKIVPFRDKAAAQPQKGSRFGKLSSLSATDQVFLQTLLDGGQLQEWEIRGVIEIQAKQPAMLRQPLSHLFVTEGYLSAEEVHALCPLSASAYAA